MQFIPYVTERDVARWEQVLSRIELTIAEDIAKKRLQRGRRIAQYFRNRITSGLLAYAKGDKNLTLRAFNEALPRFMLFFDPITVEEVELTHVYETSDQVIEIALIVQSLGLKSLAQMLLPLHVGFSDPRSVYVRAVSYLILGDSDATIAEATSLASLNSAQFGGAIPAAILAITNRNPADFLKNVQSALSDFDNVCASEARGTPEAVVFLRGVALIKLYEQANGEIVRTCDLDVRLMPG